MAKTSNSLGYSSHSFYRVCAFPGCTVRPVADEGRRPNVVYCKKHYQTSRNYSTFCHKRRLKGKSEVSLEEYAIQSSERKRPAPHSGKCVDCGVTDPTGRGGRFVEFEDEGNTVKLCQICYDARISDYLEIYVPATRMTRKI